MKNFFKRNKKHLIFLGVFLLVVILCMSIADGIQKDWGKIDVTTDTFEISYKNLEGETEEGTIKYKLYKPTTATNDAKAPGLLMLHGYQNDHETNAAYCIELARRGVVVLSIDEYGHGGTTASLIDRGYVNKKFYSVCFGEKEEVQKQLTGGAERYRIMMNFSNLSFFNDFYSKDDDGNSIIDSSMGGIAAYHMLSELSYVDNTNLAVSGHSMGTWASWSVSAAYWNSSIAPAPKATILQAGELFTKDAYDSEAIKFNNVLLLTAKWDEFNYFRDYSTKTVDDDVIQDAVTSEFLGVELGTGEWNTLYGDFATGTARQRSLFYTNHRLLTHNHDAVATAIEWLSNAYDYDMNLENNDQVFMIKEVLVLVATLTAIASMFCIMNILLGTKFFATLKQPELIVARDVNVKTGWKWWKGCLITMGIAAATYPFMTQLGHGLLPLPERTIFRMTIGNGFLSWYLLLIVIMLLTTILPFKKARKNGIEKTYIDLGLSGAEQPKKLDWKMLGKGLLLAFIMVVYMYVQCVICEAIFQLDFRFIWPFFKGYNWERLFQLLVYLPIFLVFFLLNNSKIFAQMQNKAAAQPGFKGFINSWWRNALCMIGGVIFLCLVEYIPFFMGFGPGADLLFGSTFGGPFMSLMIVFVPQVLVFSLCCTYAYRKTGSVYTGAFLVAILACWIVTGGSAIL